VVVREPQGTCGLPAVCTARSRADAAASQLDKPCTSALPLFPDDGAQPRLSRVRPSECSRERTRLGQDRIKRRAELARQTTSTEARNLARNSPARNDIGGLLNCERMERAMAPGEIAMRIPLLWLGPVPADAAQLMEIISASVPISGRSLQAQ
jgi:hypothetical protein